MNTRIVLNNAPKTNKHASMIGRQMLTLLVLLTLFGLSSYAAIGQEAFTLNGQGTIDVAKPGMSPFAIAGTTSLFGQFKCHGEINLRPGEDQDACQGAGVAVIDMANGDRLVGTVSLQTGADGDGQIAFTWCASVRLSNGSIASSTGHFATSRPAKVARRVKIKRPLIVIIAILIG